jgi:hypothetical protein
MKTLLLIKALLLILILLAISLSVSAQTKPGYEDYTPCTECFEQWKVSEGHGKTGTSTEVNLPSHKEGRQRKPFKDTYVGQTLNSSVRVIVGTTLMIATAIILTKATKPSIQ